MTTKAIIKKWVEGNPSLMSREITGGKHSLYLEYYVGYKKTYNEKKDKYNNVAIRKKEFLKLYLIDKPKTPIEKQENKDILEVAKEIQFKKKTQFQTDSTGIVLRSNLKNTNFLDFLESFINNYKKKDIRTFKRVLTQFKIFLEENYPLLSKSIRPNQITSEMVSDFLDFLQSKFRGEGPHSLYKRFKRVVKYAVKKKLINENPCDDISCQVDNLALKKDVLSVDEILTLAGTTYNGQNNEIRRAFIFCCYTGIRYCDIKELKYKDIDYSNKFLKFDQLKTTGKSSNSNVEIPLNDGLIELIGNGEREENVFRLPSHTMCLKALRTWTKKAGINKHISWHCARHSFGVNILNSGANIKTVSSLLGHSTLKMTERYVRANDELKREAIDSLPEIKL